MPVFTVLLLLLVWSVRADDISLINVTENWRYFKGITDPSPSSPLWNALDFDDSQWIESLSSVSTPESYPESTILPDYGVGYTTIYFRKEFVLEEPARVAELFFRIDYDDGFVAYLNGLEVCRRGVPGAIGTPVSLNTFAAYHPRGRTEEINLSSAIPVLTSGTNILAIELLGYATNDTRACMPGSKPNTKQLNA